MNGDHCDLRIEITCWFYSSDVLFGNAFSTDSGRCFRWVYEPGTTRPMRCQGEVVTRGWWQDRGGVWWVVEACAEHADHIRGVRPGPGARLGTRPGPVTRKQTTTHRFRSDAA